MKKYLSLITVLVLFSMTTIATGHILRRVSLNASKCSIEFIISNVSYGDVDASLDLAAASLDYCEAEWREVAIIEFPDLSEYFALGRVRRPLLILSRRCVYARKIRPVLFFPTAAILLLTGYTALLIQRPFNQN